MKKRFLLVIALLAIGLSSVTAQTVYMYGELYWKNSGKLFGKLWSAPGKYRGEMVDPDGTTTIVIYRADVNTTWLINHADKTAMVIPFSITNINSVVGMEIEKGRTTTQKYIRDEEVEGKMCKRYEVTITITNADGTKSTGGFTGWLYPPINTWLQRQDGPNDEPQVLRNYVMGAQPDHFFEVPKGYKIINFPQGGLLDKLPGQQPSNNQQQQQTEDRLKALQDLLNKK